MVMEEALPKYIARVLIEMEELEALDDFRANQVFAEYFRCVLNPTQNTHLGQVLKLNVRRVDNGEGEEESRDS